MAEWLFEAGVGEARAALVQDGAIVRATREWPGLRVGSVRRARWAEELVGRRAVRVEWDGGAALLQPVPPSFGPGQTLAVEVVREGIGAKLPRARPAADGAERDGPALHDRLAATGLPVRALPAFGPDCLEAAGWSELLEEAATGVVAFPGGLLRVEQTAAGVTIDVDGGLDPEPLAVAGAAAAARAIGRLGLGGSVLIDLPTVSNREARARSAAAFDAAMAVPFERTAVNGFGLLQAVLPRSRASLLEQARGDPARAEAAALARRAGREPPPGTVAVVANTAVSAHIDVAALARLRGAPVVWRPDPARAIGRGDVMREE